MKCELNDILENSVPSVTTWDEKCGKRYIPITISLSDYEKEWLVVICINEDWAMSKAFREFLKLYACTFVRFYKNSEKKE